MRNTILQTTLLLFGFSLNAQQQFTNNGSIKIHPGAGIAFKGDFINNGSFTDAGQMAFFTGTSAQNISGSSATTFNNLTIANSGAGILLSGTVNVTVANALTLTSGVVTTGSNIFILSTTTAANLSYTNGFIYGTFRRYIVSNTDTYLFPLGDGAISTNRHRIAFVNNTLAGVSYLDASVTSFVQAVPNNDATLSTTQGGTPITETVGEAAGKTTIWTLTPDAVPSGGSYGVQLFAENTTLSASDDDMFCPMKRDGAASYADFLTSDGTTSMPASGAAGRIYNSGNGYAQRIGYTSFSQHAIGKSVSPLPVELIEFYAKANDNRVDVTWKTASEFNSDYFTVEKTSDGISYETVAVVDAAGNSTLELKYSARDNNPSSGVSYYRLRQTDLNGQYSYSKKVEVDFNNTGSFSVSVFPVPVVNDNINVSIADTDGKEVLIVIRDVLGDEFYSKIISDNSGTYIFSLNNELSPGIYFITASTDEKLVSSKIVVIK
ncbi:MAG: T9SS type A sorting domain-containing protein [Bacteroidetes bacterium]|nr:T9SS type A sorting domain-containing protein [Bacteroidota bacterium]